MTDNCLFVHGLTSSINLPILQQLFSFYGNCQIQHAGEQALVQYERNESCLQAMQFLDNTNLLSANGQTNVSMQIVDIAALARQTAEMGNSVQPPQNSVPNNNNRSVPKKSQNKEFQNDNNQRSYSMNIENRERSNSPFQSNNNQVQNNASRSLGKNMNITPNTKSQQQQQQQNNNGNMLRNLPGGSMNKIMNDKENFRSTIQNKKFPVLGYNIFERIAYVVRGQNFDHSYLKTKPNPNPKVSTLINFYKTNKTNVPNDKVKVFSNYDEFWQDMKKNPRSRESNNNSYSEIRPTHKPINYDKYTIAELTIELKKRGHIMSGTKQTLRYALEQLNEGL